MVSESNSISVSFQVEQVRVQVVLPRNTEIQIGGTGYSFNCDTDDQ